MPFIVELSKTISSDKVIASAARFLLLKSCNNILIRDNFGIIGLQNKSDLKESPFIKIFQANKHENFLENLSSETLQTENQALLKNEKIAFDTFKKISFEDQIIRIYSLNSQSLLYAKLKNSKLLEENPDFVIRCKKTGLQLKLFRNSKVSVGSSEFDCIQIPCLGIKPRHANLILGRDLSDSRVEGCLGQVESRLINNTINFELLDSGIKFELSISPCPQRKEPGCLQPVKCY